MPTADMETIFSLKKALRRSTAALLKSLGPHEIQRQCESRETPMFHSDKRQQDCFAHYIHCFAGSSSSSQIPDSIETAAAKRTVCQLLPLHGLGRIVY